MNTISSTRTLLNPNAREFVPIYLKSSSSATVTVTGDETEPSAVSDIGKTFSDKTVSSDTRASDEESRRYWSTQLPDDILTPDTDFFTPAVDDTIEPGPRMSACESSSRNDAVDYVANNPSRISTALNGILQPGPVHVAAHDHMTGHNISRQLWDEEYTLSSVPLSSRTGDWNRQLSGGGNGLMHSSALGETPFKVSSTVHALNALGNEFPNIPEQTLAEVYQANGGDLGLTIRAIHQLKLQGEASLWHGMPSPGHFSPNTRPLGFSTTSTPDSACRSSHFIEGFDGQHKELSRIMRKNESQWPLDHHGPGEFSLRPCSFSSMNPHSNVFDVELNDDKRGTSLARHKRWLSPRNWVETDDGLEKILSELREEARNHSHMCNVYLEQAREAMYVGNRVLVKEAIAKEQFHNRLMKAAETKAAEVDLQRTIYNCQPSSLGPGQMQLLDLRGLHVNEAIHILKRSLAALRLAARSSRQRQQVFISIGTGHQKNARTPARLLFAVKRYLTEEELLNFTEAQPGILKVSVS